MLTRPTAPGTACVTCLETDIQLRRGAEGLGRATSSAGTGDTSQGHLPALTKPDAEDTGTCFRKKGEGVKSSAIHKSECAPKGPSLSPSSGSLRRGRRGWGAATFLPLDPTFESQANYRPDSLVQGTRRKGCLMLGKGGRGRRTDPDTQQGLETHVHCRTPQLWCFGTVCSRGYYDAQGGVLSGLSCLWMCVVNNH